VIGGRTGGEAVEGADGGRQGDGGPIPLFEQLVHGELGFHVSLLAGLIEHLVEVAAAQAAVGARNCREFRVGPLR
jgi:hypothetical protein